MNASHTATPWKQDQYGNVVDQGGRDRIVLSGFALSTGRQNPEAESNTEFVFRACNAHDDLVALLKEISQIEIDGMHLKDWNALIKRIDKSIAKTTGEQQ